VINGEKATLNTPLFSKKRERTLDMLIRDLYQEHITENRMVSLILDLDRFSYLFIRWTCLPNLNSEYVCT